jgi:glycosyltransferase involved in cell wall biosynthesis
MKVSTIIVTRNRSQELKHVLGSLATQDQKLDELIVVDNNSDDETKQLVKSFVKNTNFPVKYILEKTQGYPLVYNRGIREASYDWVAFIDDDCVASAYWFNSVKKAVKNHPQAAAILGCSHTFYKKNIFSLTTLIFDEFWKNSAINKDNRVVDLEILDNKNIAYNKKFLLKKNTFFSEEIVKYFNGACEDSDLGMKLQQAGGKAYYVAEMYIEHKDPINLLWYYKKLIFSARSHALYEQRWSDFRSKLTVRSKLKIVDFLSSFMERENLQFLDRLAIYFHVFLSIVFNKLSKFML